MTKKNRRAWNPAIGAARFSERMRHAAALTDPRPLTPEEVTAIALPGRIGLEALHRGDAQPEQVASVLGALNACQVLVDAGAGAEYMPQVVAALRAGCELRARFEVGRQLIATPDELQAMAEGLDVYEAILEAGLVGAELVKAIDEVSALVKRGHTLRASQTKD